MADKKISQLTPATTPLAGTEVLPIVQNGTTDNITVNNLAAGNIKSNATTGVLQVTGPAAASTRVMTTPDANFTVARTDAAQNFTGNNTFDTTTLCIDATNDRIGVGIATPVNKNQTYQASVVSVPAAGAGGHTVAIGDTGFGLAVGALTSGKSYLQGTRWDGVAANYNLVLQPNGNDVEIGNGNLVIGTSGKGIDFSATASGSGTMTSELLTDYEEGTWTATIYGGTTAGTTTYLDRTGDYIKIGKQVTVTIYCGASATTGTGELRIGGLPFSSGTNKFSVGALQVSSLNWDGGTYLTLYCGPSRDYASIYYCADDASWAAQQITNELQLYMFSLTYFTD